MGKFLSFQLAVIATTLSYLQTTSAYQSWQENEYLSNFDTLESNSYSAINDIDVAPPTLLSECKRGINATDVVFDGSEIILEADGVDEANENIETVSAASAQVQCNVNEASVCVVPRGLRLKMSSSLNVPALIVRGEIYWRDVDLASSEEEDTYLCGGYIAVEGPVGKFVINFGSISNKRGWIYLKDNGAIHPMGRSRFFGGVGDTNGGTSLVNSFGPMVDITGFKLQRTWSLLAEPFLQNQESFKLLHT